MGVQRTWCPRLRNKDLTDRFLAQQQAGEHITERVRTLLETHDTRCRQNTGARCQRRTPMAWVDSAAGLRFANVSALTVPQN